MLRLICVGFVASWCFVSTVAAQAVFPETDWQVATPESQHMDAAGLERAKVWLESHRSDSGLVIRHGKIVAEWYFGDRDAKSLLPVYSTTKSLTSLATGLAIQEGKLTLDHAVGKSLPAVRPTGKKDITVKQLLSMTSGVHNLPEFHLRADIFDYSQFEAAMDYRPGEKWDYNNTGLALLGPVFEQATGESLDQFLDQRVFQPIGITSDDWEWEHRDGHTIPYSGCQLTARAMGRIGLLVLRDGHWKDRQIIPVEWLKASIAPSQDMNPSYGYLWWNNTTNKWPGVPQDAFAALGKWDNDILIVPSLDLIVIRQAEQEPVKGHQIAEYFQLVCDAVKKP